MRVMFGCECDKCRIHCSVSRDLRGPAVLVEVATLAMGFNPGQLGVPAAKAPVAYVIRRDGRLMRVCTRCNTLMDEHVSRLFDRETDFSVFRRYDDMGGYLAETRVDEAVWEEVQAHTGR